VTVIYSGTYNVIYPEGVPEMRTGLEVEVPEPLATELTTTRSDEFTEAV